MKNILYYLWALALLSTPSWSQTDPDRTVSTKIADLLVQFPAVNSKQLEKNMAEMAVLGKDGIVQIASMLVPAVKGDNAKIQYAIGGFTYASSQSGKEAWRKLAAEAYGEALAKVSDVDSKVFLMYQLQTVGKDESVNTLKAYLGDTNLSGPASRALARIGTPAAGAALKRALLDTQGAIQIGLVEALGIAKYKDATSEIEKIARTSDQKLRKVSLFALSEIAEPSSLNMLSDGANKVAYAYDDTDATTVYLKYLANLVKNGNNIIAEKAALNLINSATPIVPSGVKSSALNIYAGSKKRESVPVLVSALKSNDPQYRATALKLGQQFTMANGTVPWLTAMKAAKPGIQAEIITMLGHAKSIDALPTVTKSLSSKDNKVKLAAVWAIGKIGGESSVANLIPIFRSGNADNISAVKNALSTIKGAAVVDQLGAALPNLPASAQPAAIELLADRMAVSALPAVSSLLKSPDSRVKMAAFSALKSISTTSNLPQLYTLLNTVESSEEIGQVQSAISQTIADVGPVSTSSAAILEQMQAAPAQVKSRYLSILATIGDQTSLAAVSSAYGSGDSFTKKAAIEALSQWSNASAAPELLSIAGKTLDNEEHTAVVNGYVASLAKSGKTPENKVIMLRNMMKLAKTHTQKQLILRELSKSKTLNALLFAGSYLDEGPVQQAAAQAVMHIALGNHSLYGSKITELLNKTISVISGQDSDYQKQAIRKHLAELPTGAGFVSLFNEKDLTGWKGLVANPVIRRQMPADTLAAHQKIADSKMQEGWYVKNGELVFSGHGDNLCTIQKYGDFEMYVDWKILKDGDAGIYLRGTPQVQIWDTSRVSVGAQVGSGGLYNNLTNESKPYKVADNEVGDWNTFHITMIGDRVSVDLNGENVANNVTLENYWNRNIPIFDTEQIELQAHGNEIFYRDVYVREISRPEPFQLSEEEKKEGYKVLFDGTHMFEWIGNKTDYYIDNGDLAIDPKRGGEGNLYTKDEFSDFIYRFDFQLTPSANNGLGIRTPLQGDAAYVGTEIQILDNTADVYKNLKDYQYHGSAYGIIPAKRGFLKPVGEWNTEEVYLKGSKIKVTLNGEVILDGDLAEASKNGTADHREHPGLQRTSGHIGYLGHGNPLKFRNIRILDLTKVQEIPIIQKGKKVKKKKK